MQVVTLRGSNLIEVRALLHASEPLKISLRPARRSLTRSLVAAVLCLLGHGRRGRQVPCPVPGQVPEELLDQER
jgi:hypothetical protein